MSYLGKKTNVLHINTCSITVKPQLCTCCHWFVCHAEQELRLVVLGEAATGKTSAVCTILGLQDSQQDSGDVRIQECTKHAGDAAGRKVKHAGHLLQ